MCELSTHWSQMEKYTIVQLMIVWIIQDVWINQGQIIGAILYFILLY